MKISTYILMDYKKFEVLNSLLETPTIPVWEGLTFLFHLFPVALENKVISNRGRNTF